MNPWLRKLLGPYLAEAGDPDTGGAPQEVPTEPQGEPQSEPAEEPAPQKEPATPVDEDAMAEAIFEKLKEESHTQVRDTTTGKFVPRDTLKAQSKPAPAAPAAPAAEKATESPPAPKKTDDFQLTPEEKKLLSSKAQARFHELHSHAKAKESEVAAIQQEYQKLKQARDDIVTTLTEHHTNSDELIQLLTYNKALKTGDLEGALRLLETQRAQIYKALGKEAPGVDLLDDQPDLKERVEAMEMDRNAAVEVAHARRISERQTMAQQQQAERQQQDSAHQQKIAAVTDEITAWENAVKGRDIDYPDKLGKLNAQVAGVLQKYPPELWLPTLQLIYEGIQVVKSQAITPAATPLRPTGARGGSPTPASMEQAIASRVAPHLTGF